MSSLIAITAEPRARSPSIALRGGEVRIGDRVVNELGPRDRDVAMVFQNYALYPHMSVAENLAFGLRMRKVPKAKQRERVEEIARVLGLSEHLERRPAQLSGGQRQRVAMGRAIVREPQAFLMDEPLSNLDAKLRVQMRAEIARIQRALKVTTLYVTHDQVEAMTMGDRVAVMRRGELQQTDEPQRLYSSPANLFVASFVGSPAMNLLEARLERRSGTLVCELGETELELPVETLARRPALERYVGRTVGLGIRPEHVQEANGEASPGRLRGEALLVEALGAELFAHVEVAATPLVREDVLEGATENEEPLPVASRRATLVGRFDPSSRVRAGDIVELALDARRLHFFDLETSLVIEPVDVPVAAGMAG